MNRFVPSISLSLLVISFLTFSAKGFGAEDIAGEEAFEQLVSGDSNAKSFVVANSATDPFTQLTQLFDAEEATAPTVDELRPWFTGRCYSVDNKTRSMPSVLFVKQTDDGGPLFPDLGTNKLYIRLGGGENPASYDRVNNATKAVVEEHYGSVKAKLTRARVIDDGVTDSGAVRRSLTNTDFNNTTLVRKVRKVVRGSRTYFVSQFAVAMDTTYGNVQYREGDLWYACYHFAQVEFVNP